MSEALSDSVYARIMQQLKQHIVSHWLSLLEAPGTASAVDAVDAESGGGGVAIPTGAQSLVAAFGHLHRHTSHQSVRAVADSTAAALIGATIHASADATASRTAREPAAAAVLAAARLTLVCGVTALGTEDAQDHTVATFARLIHIFVADLASSVASDPTPPPAAAAATRAAIRDVLAAALQLCTSSHLPTVHTALTAVTSLPHPHGVIGVEALAACTNPLVRGAALPPGVADAVVEGACSLLSDESATAHLTALAQQEAAVQQQQQRVLGAAEAASAASRRRRSEPGAPASQGRRPSEPLSSTSSSRASSSTAPQHQTHGRRPIGEVGPTGVVACTDAGAVLAFLLDAPTPTTTQPDDGVESSSTAVLAPLLPHAVCARLVSDVRGRLMALRYSHAIADTRTASAVADATTHGGPEGDDVMGPEDNRGGGGGARGATANEDDEFDDGFVFAGDDASAGDWDGAFDDTNALTPGGASGAGAVSWLIDAVPRLLAAATSRCVAAFACTGSGVHREDTAGDVLHQTAATLAQLMDAVAAGEAAVLRNAPARSCAAVVFACKHTASACVGAGAAAAGDEVLFKVQRVCLLALVDMMQGQAAAEEGVWAHARVAGVRGFISLLGKLGCFATPRQAAGARQCAFVRLLARTSGPLHAAVHRIAHLRPRAALAVELALTFGECELGRTDGDYRPARWRRGAVARGRTDEENVHAMLNALQAWVLLLTHGSLAAMWRKHGSEHRACLVAALVLAESCSEALAANAAASAVVAQTVAECNDALVGVVLELSRDDLAAVATALTDRISRAPVPDGRAQDMGESSGAADEEESGAGFADEEDEEDDGDEDDNDDDNDEDEGRSPGLLAEVRALAGVLAARAHSDHSQPDSDGAPELVMDMRKWLSVAEDAGGLSQGRLHVMQTLLSSVDVSCMDIQLLRDTAAQLQRMFDEDSAGANAAMGGSNSCGDDDHSDDDDDELDEDDEFETRLYPLAAGVSLAAAITSVEYAQQAKVDQSRMEKMSMGEHGERGGCSCASVSVCVCVCVYVCAFLHSCAFCFLIC